MSPRGKFPFGKNTIKGLKTIEDHRTKTKVPWEAILNTLMLDVMFLLIIFYLQYQ